MLEQFHFIHPLWLLALLPLAGLIWLLRQRSGDDNAWRKVVDPSLLPLLLSHGEGHASRSALWLLAVGWLIAVLALADPTWEKRPQPLFETQQARVIVLDLSRSMNASDLKPSRLFQARLKVEDILDREDEGQLGLVVFAGDAFSVVPLTRDSDTIRAMLRVLTPDLMPVQGSRADLGLKQAGELLQQAGVPKGEILLITDGIQSDAAIEQAGRLHRQGYRVSVLGVGTTDGAGVPDGRGGVLTDQQGKPVIARLDQQLLQRLAAAGGGAYAQLQNSDQDLDRVLGDPSTPLLSDLGKTKQSEQTSHVWKEQGPLLAVLLLPLAALAFRRGWLLSLVLAGALMPLPEPAIAQDPANTPDDGPDGVSAIWQDLWKRRDQQAAEALSMGDAETAARLAQDPLRLGSAEYRKQDFQAALQAFEKAQGPDADYNRGNALARLGRYEEAIDAYDQALRQAPEMADARANKAAVEKLLQQQKKRQQSQEQQQQRGQQRKNGQQQQSGQGQNKNQQGQSTGKPDRQKSGAGNSSQAQQDRNGENRQRQSANSGQQRKDDSKDGSSANGKEEQENKASDKQPSEDSDNAFSNAAETLKKQQREASANGQEQKGEKAPAAADREPGQQGKQNPKEAGNDKSHQPAQRARATTSGTAEGQAKPLSSEEQLAAEQWLRRIPDDPGGLLRRKFLYQYQQRRGRPTNNEQNW